MGAVVGWEADAVARAEVAVAMVAAVVAEAAGARSTLGRTR